MSKLREHWSQSKIRRRPAWLEPRSLVVQVCCAALLTASGCTTMETVEPQAASESSLQLEAGDQLAISLRDGRRLELSFVEWTAEALAGTDSDGTLHRIAREDISQLEVEQFSVLGSLGVVAVVLGMVIAAGGSASGFY